MLETQIEDSTWRSLTRQKNSAEKRGSQQGFMVGCPDGIDILTKKMKEISILRLKGHG